MWGEGREMDGYIMDVGEAGCMRSELQQLTHALFAGYTSNVGRQVPSPIHRLHIYIYEVKRNYIMHIASAYIFVSGVFHFSYFLGFQLREKSWANVILLVVLIPKV